VGREPLGERRADAARRAGDEDALTAQNREIRGSDLATIASARDKQKPSRTLR
jgi:hypothetical protein